MAELSRGLWRPRRASAALARGAGGLPGVGRKTANVVLNVAFGEPTIAVDTHIFRVGNRTGMAPGKDPFEVEQKLDQVVPAHYKSHAHHWLILHGRYTCVARRALSKFISPGHLRMAGKNGLVRTALGECVWKTEPRARPSDKQIRK